MLHDRPRKQKFTEEAKWFNTIKKPSNVSTGMAPLV